MLLSPLCWSVWYEVECAALASESEKQLVSKLTAVLSGPFPNSCYGTPVAPVLSAYQCSLLGECRVSILVVCSRSEPGEQRIVDSRFPDLLGELSMCKQCVPGSLLRLWE